MFTLILDKPDFPSEYQDSSDKIIDLMRQKKVPPISEMLKEAHDMGVMVIVCSAGQDYMDIEGISRPDLIDDSLGTAESPHHG